MAAGGEGGGSDGGDIIPTGIPVFEQDLKRERGSSGEAGLDANDVEVAEPASPTTVRRSFSDSAAFSEGRSSVDSLSHSTIDDGSGRPHSDSRSSNRKDHENRDDGEAGEDGEGSARRRRGSGRRRNVRSSHSSSGFSSEFGEPRRHHKSHGHRGDQGVHHDGFFHEQRSGNTEGGGSSHSPSYSRDRNHFRDPRFDDDRDRSSAAGRRRDAGVRGLPPSARNMGHLSNTMVGQWSPHLRPAPLTPTVSPIGPVAASTRTLTHRHGLEITDQSLSPRNAAGIGGGGGGGGGGAGLRGEGRKGHRRTRSWPGPMASPWKVGVVWQHSNSDGFGDAAAAGQDEERGMGEDGTREGQGKGGQGGRSGTLDRVLIPDIPYSAPLVPMAEPMAGVSPLQFGEAEGGTVLHGGIHTGGNPPPGALSHMLMSPSTPGGKWADGRRGHMGSGAHAGGGRGSSGSGGSLNMFRLGAGLAQGLDLGGSGEGKKEGDEEGGEWTVVNGGGRSLLRRRTRENSGGSTGGNSVSETSPLSKEEGGDRDAQGGGKVGGIGGVEGGVEGGAEEGGVGEDGAVSVMASPGPGDDASKWGGLQGRFWAQGGDSFPASPSPTHTADESSSWGHATPEKEGRGGGEGEARSGARAGDGNGSSVGVMAQLWAGQGGSKVGYLGRTVDTPSMQGEVGVEGDGEGDRKGGGEGGESQIVSKSLPNSPARMQHHGSGGDRWEGGLEGGGEEGGGSGGRARRAVTSPDRPLLRGPVPQWDHNPANTVNESHASRATGRATGRAAGRAATGRVSPPTKGIDLLTRPGAMRGAIRGVGVGAGVVEPTGVPVVGPTVGPMVRAVTTNPITSGAAVPVVHRSASDGMAGGVGRDEAEAGGRAQLAVVTVPASGGVGGGGSSSSAKDSKDENAHQSHTMVCAARYVERRKEKETWS